jgi:hypothetical protein
MCVVENARMKSPGSDHWSKGEGNPDHDVIETDGYCWAGLHFRHTLLGQATQSVGSEQEFLEIFVWSRRDNIPTDCQLDWRPHSSSRQVWSRRHRIMPSVEVRV